MEYDGEGIRTMRMRGGSQNNEGEGIKIMSMMGRFQNNTVSVTVSIEVRIKVKNTDK